MSDKQIRERNTLEEDGLYVSDMEHWELIENESCHIYKSKYISKYNSEQTIKEYLRTHEFCIVRLYIPLQIVKHLNLKDKDKVDIAIKRHKEE